jgi:hypothetical protein
MDEGQTMKPYRNLLSAVILQAVLDIWKHRHDEKTGMFAIRKRRTGEKDTTWRNYNYHKKNQLMYSVNNHDQAISWMNGNSGRINFYDACLILDIDPDLLKGIVFAGPPQDFSPKHLGKFLEV